jgi:hypothetical protein
MLNLTQTGPYGSTATPPATPPAVHKKNVTSAGAAPSTGQASNRETKLDDIDTHAACGGAGHATHGGCDLETVQVRHLDLGGFIDPPLADLSLGWLGGAPYQTRRNSARSESEFSLPTIRPGNKPQKASPREEETGGECAESSPAIVVAANFTPARRAPQVFPPGVALQRGSRTLSGVPRLVPPSELAYSSTRPSRLANTLRDRCSWHAR